MITMSAEDRRTSQDIAWEDFDILRTMVFLSTILMRDGEKIPPFVPDGLLFALNRAYDSMARVWDDEITSEN